MECMICGGRILGPPYYYDPMTMMYFHKECVDNHQPDLIPSMEVVNE